MALPSSGSMTAAMINAELGRAANAAFSLNGAAERVLAGVSSGAISMASFYGKSSEIVVNMAAGGAAVTLESLFSAADWVSETQKRVILPAGVERGNSANANAAVTVGTTGWGGNLIFEVRGTISGRGGTANSGVGGNALQANRVGNANQKLSLILTGTLRGGGGGGGLGGTGGSGSNSSLVQEGPTFSSYSYQWMTFYAEDGPSIPLTHIMWAGQDLYYGYDGGASGTQWGSAGPLNLGGWDYYRGSSVEGHGGDPNTYQIYRQRWDSVPTVGGTGGVGGKGEGYDGARTSGASGAAGGANAGAGGTGGAGGLYGASGGTGSTGANGNASNGAAGAAGGLAGFGLLNAANVNLTNSGTIQGRTG